MNEQVAKPSGHFTIRPVLTTPLYLYLNVTKKHWLYKSRQITFLHLSLLAEM